MKHRLTTETGLGSGDKAIMNNKWTGEEKLDGVVKDMLAEGIELWFKDLGGVDFDIHRVGLKLDRYVEVTFGFEPTYQYDHLRTYIISSDYTISRWQQGIAWGAYGSGVASNFKFVTDYKYNSKFQRFAKKWSEKLKEALKDVAV